MRVSAENGIEADIYLYQSGMELPRKGNYYVVTADGVFLHIDDGAMSGLVPCNTLSPFLGNLSPEAHWNFPPIPCSIFTQALVFLRAVYNKYHSESCLILFYKRPSKNFLLKQAARELKEMKSKFPSNQKEWNLEQRTNVIHQVNVIKEIEEGVIDHSQCQYVIGCPKQIVTPFSIRYGEFARESISDLVKEFKENDPSDDYHYMQVCSIHSHPSFNAYHSKVDDSDEFDWDGLHLTVGNIMKDKFEISVSLTLQGNRFNKNPLDVLVGIEQTILKNKVVYSLVSDFDGEDFREKANNWVENKVKAESDSLSWGRLKMRESPIGASVFKKEEDENS